MTHEHMPLHVPRCGTPLEMDRRHISETVELGWLAGWLTGRQGATQESSHVMSCHVM